MHAWLRMENLDWVSLIPDPHDQSWGRCITRSTATRDYPRWRLAARKRLLFRMAGGQAELLFPRARVPSNSGDLEDALKLSGTLFPQSQERALRYVLIQEQRARRLVRGVLRTPILEFADILQQQVEIGRWEAHDILMRLLGIRDYWDRLPQRKGRTRGLARKLSRHHRPSIVTHMNV